MDFIGYKYIATLIVVSEIFLLLLTYKRNPKLAIYAVLLSIFLKGQYLWIGRAVYAWQIAACLGLAYLFLARNRRVVMGAGRELGLFHASLLLYFSYTFLISIPMWLFFSAKGLGDVGTQVSLSRVMTQSIYFLFLIGLYGLGTWAARYLTTIELLRAIILIAVFAAYGAILQSLIMQFFGINIFPIIGSDDTVRSAYIMGVTFRASSFVGEPKHLGLLMSIGLISLFMTRLFRVSIRRWSGFHKPLVMVVALLLSLSTTGMAVTVSGIAALAVIYLRRLRLMDVVVLGILAVVVMTQLIGTGSNFSASLESQISRTGFEIQDESVMRVFMANPGLILTGTGLGNIHLLAVDYLPPYFPLFRDYGYKANSGLFFVMGDSGLLGLLLLISGPMFAAFGANRMRRHLDNEQRIEAFSSVALILVSLISFMLRYDAVFFFFSGFVFIRLAFLRSQTFSLDKTAKAYLQDIAVMKASEIGIK